MLKQRSRYPLIALSMAILCMAGFSGTACAQSQEDSAPSVAEAARRTREQKKNAAKPVKTLTNDDLPAAPAASSNQASAPVNAAESGAATPGGASATPANAEGDEQAKLKKEENAEALERAKKELARAEHELDVMQRKAALDSDSYFSKTDFASDTAGKANLDAEAQEINAKKEDIDKLKARVAELQEAVGDAAPAEPEKNPPPQ